MSAAPIEPGPDEPEKKRRGRRPGVSTARTAILEAARRRFAAGGYAATSIRAIAGDAAVDPALVAHYFGGKRDLFETALELPPHFDLTIRRALAEDPARPGDAVVREFVDACDRWPGLSGLVRAAVADDGARRRLADYLTLSLVAPLAATFVARRTKLKLRANLILAQLLGLALTRSIVPMEPIASASSRALAGVYGSAVTAILAGTDFT